MLKHYVARHKLLLNYCDFYYHNMSEAKFKNKHFEDWQEVI